MQIEASDFFKGAAAGFALLALTVVGMQIDARSTLRIKAPTIFTVEKNVPVCKAEEKFDISADHICKVNFKKEVASGTSPK